LILAKPLRTRSGLALSRSARQSLLNRSLQSLNGRRLRDAGHDRFLFHDHLPRIRMSGNEYHWNAAFGNDFSGRETVDDWHIEVDECDIDVVKLALVDQFFAIANRTNDFVAETFEQPHECLANVGLVLGDGDSYGR
jgi:hypothetical protein